MCMHLKYIVFSYKACKHSNRTACTCTHTRNFMLTFWVNQPCICLFQPCPSDAAEKYKMNKITQVGREKKSNTEKKTYIRTKKEPTEHLTKVN